MHGRAGVVQQVTACTVAAEARAAASQEPSSGAAVARRTLQRSRMEEG